MTTSAWFDSEDDPFQDGTTHNQPQQPYTLKNLFADIEQQAPETPNAGTTANALQDPEDVPDIDLNENPDQHNPNCWPNPGDSDIPPGCDYYTAVVALTNQLNAAHSVIKHIEDNPNLPYEHHAAYVAKVQMAQHNLFDAIQHFNSADPEHPAIIAAHELQSSYESAQQHAYDIVAKHGRITDSRTTQGLETYLDQEQIPYCIAIIYDTFTVQSATSSMEWARSKMAEAETPEWCNAYRWTFFNSYHDAKTHHQRLTENPFYNEINDHERELVDHALIDFEVMHNHALKAFNRDEPLYISPNIIAVSDEMAEQARAILIEPIGFDYGILTASDNKPADQEQCIPYIAYYHDGIRRVQPIQDPFPRGFPNSLATKYLFQVAQSFSCDEIAVQQEVRTLAMDRSAVAASGIHSVSRLNIHNLVSHARNMGVSDTTIYEVISNLVGDNRNTANHIADTSNLHVPSITSKQAQAVVYAARNTGLDESTIANIAAAMYQPDFESLGIELTPISARHKRRLLRYAEHIGFTELALDHLAEALDRAYY